MAFLNIEDYSGQVKQDVLALVSGSEPIRQSAELKAQSEMESYLRTRYDVVNIFNKTGSERVPVIVLYLIDMTLYHLHSNISPRNIPELRKERYDIAIDWLKRVSKGQLSPDLPVPENEGEGSLFRGGFNKKASTRY
jgi:phage gp36-like protein